MPGDIGMVISVLSIFSSAKDFLQWVSSNEKEPISIAFNNVVQQFEEDLPNIKEQLSDFLIKNEIQNELERRATNDEFFNETDKIVRKFVESEEIYFENEDKAFRIAAEVLNTFVNEFKQALFRSNDGLNFLDKRIDDKLEKLNLDLNTGTPSKIADKWKIRLEQYKKLTKDEGAKAAIKSWETFKEDLEHIDEIEDDELRFQVLTNLASCYWQLGKNNKAKELFIKSSKFNVNVTKKKRVRAIGYMINGEFNKAHHKIDEALEIDEVNQVSLAIKSSIYLSEDNYNDIINLFKRYRDSETGEYNLKNEDCLRILGISLIELDLFDDAIKLFNKAKEKNNYNPQIDLLLANALMNKISTQDNFTLTEKEYNILLEAQKLLEKAIETFEKRKNKKELSNALGMLAGIKFNMNKTDKALELAEKALKLNNNNINAKKNFVVASFSNLKYLNKATNILEDWIEVEKSDEVISLLLTSYELKADKTKFNKLDNIFASRYSNDLNKIPLDILFRYAKYLYSINNDKLNIIIEKILDLYPESPIGYLLKSRLLFNNGDDIEAERLAKEAKSFIKNNENHEIILNIASLFFDMQMWEEAINTYNLIEINERSPKDIVLNVLWAKYNADKSKYEQEILDLASSYRKFKGLDIDITEIEATILDIRREINKSMDLWNKLHQKYNEVSFYINYIRTLYLNGDVEKVKNKILDIDYNLKEINSRSLLLLAELSNIIGLKEKPLFYAYEAWRNGRENQIINFGYISLFLKVTQESSFDFSIEKVKSGVAVTVNFLENDNNEIYVIISSGNKILSEEEEITSEIANKLFDKSVGDKIIWHQNPYFKKEAKIIELRHKYVWAFQKALKTHFKKFPNDQSLIQFTVDEQLNNLFSILDSHSENLNKVIDIYKNNSLPLALISNLIGKNSFEVWNGFLSNSTLSFRFASNSIKDKDKEKTALKMAKSIILDSTALFTLQMIGILEHLNNYFENIVVPQQVYESIREIKDNLKIFAKDGQEYMGKANGKYYLEGVSKNTIQEKIKFLNKIIDYCEKDAIRKGRPRVYNENEYELLLNVIGEEFLSPIIIADYLENAVLYSDDLNLRKLTLQQYGVKGINTYTVLEYLNINGKIDDYKYSTYLLKMIKANYKQVSISKKILIAIIKNDMSVNNQDYKLLINKLFIEEVDIRSAINVSASFIRELLLNNIFALVEPFIINLIEKIFKRAGNKGVNFFKKKVLQNHIIIIPNFERFKDLLYEWKRAHYLI